MKKMKSDSKIIPSEIWSPLMQQQLFRGLLDAFSYPGRITVCTRSDVPSWLAILTSLVDGETTLADPEKLLTDEMWSKLEVRHSAPEKAAYILLNGSRAPELMPNLGTLEAPEEGTTILLLVEALHRDMSGKVRMQLRGPGIKEATSISVDGLHLSWIESRNNWVSAFPLGVDIVLCDEHQFLAIPRTTHLNLEVSI
jgi:alpha-D-ribose 1-methylphosphonate 5-triphosphate synthase subunit PhnH